MERLPTVEKNTMLLIKADGSEQVIAGKPENRTMHKLVGDCLDFVRIGKLDNSDLTMAVDDFGYETVTIDHGNGKIELKPIAARLPDNAKATEFYHAICLPGTIHRIVGDVVIFHDDDVP
jgi:hypothetical protein